MKLREEFQLDTNLQTKIDLGIGVYKNQDGTGHIFKAVQKVLQNQTHTTLINTYLPQLGHPHFIKLTQSLVFGQDSPLLQQTQRLITMQTTGGTGALYIIASSLFAAGRREIFLPNLSWASHESMFSSLGFSVPQYRYFDTDTGKLDLRGIVEGLSNASMGSVFLFQASGHNPTGVDLSEEEWKVVTKKIEEKKHFIIFDLAYQGMVSGDIDADASAVRYFAQRRKAEFAVAQAYSKNMGLYAERVGSLSVYLHDMDDSDKLTKLLKALVRRTYSSPPAHGAQIVTAVLSDAELRDEWLAELRDIAEYIKTQRQLLFRSLNRFGGAIPHGMRTFSNGDQCMWSHIVTQRGMFSVLGLSPDQVLEIRRKEHIYFTVDGRINVAALTEKKCLRLAQAIRAVSVPASG